MRKIALLLALFCAVPLSAQALNIQNRRFYFHGGRADTLVESTPKAMDTLTLGLSSSFALDPFELGNSTTTVTPQDIVSYMFTFDLGASYSFSDRIALGVNLPIHVTNNIQSLTSLTEETVMSLGDIQVSGLYNLIPRDSNNMGIGVGLVPYLSFPTGVSSNFVGDSNVTAGFLVAADLEANSHYLGLNLGVRFREEENLLNLRVAQEMLYSVAYQHPIWEEQELAGFAEVSGSTVMNDFFQNANSSPVEAKIGLSKVFLPDTPLLVKVVNGVGFGNGYGNPDYRAVISVSYDHYLPRTKVIEKTVTVERVERVEKVEQQLKDLTIYYPTDGDQVDPFYDQKIAGIAQVMKDNPDMGPLYIVGHTDDVDDDNYNLQLSERRAKQAYESIVQKGLSPRQIVWFGVGETDPIIPNTTDANRALNRRTVFTFQKPKQLVEKGLMPQGSHGENFAPSVSSDSYTEVLKAQQQGFVDDSGANANPTPEVTQPTTYENVTVKEEIVSKPQKKSSRKKNKDTLKEENLDEDENFDEPFSE